MEPEKTMAGVPRYADFSVQQRQTGLNEFIRVSRNAGGSLSTRTFFEKPHHGGEVDALDPIDWKEKVPEGAALRGSNAGAGSGAIPNYWVVWPEPGTLKALSIYQENALSLPMEPEDSLIDGPVLEIEGKLHVYFLRRGPQGHDLYEHVFTGAAKKKGSGSTAKLAAIPGEPLFLRADPIALHYGAEKPADEVVGTAVIGWLTREGNGLRAHAAWLDGSGARLFASDPIAGYAPFPQQRIGLWANPDSGALRLAFIMGRADNDTVRLAEWRVWTRTGAQNIRIDARGLGGSNVRAAACVIRRTDYTPRTNCYYLSRTGRLYEQNREGIRKIREGVPPGYDFPIYASAQAVWEAKPDGHGGIRFDLPSSGPEE